GLRVETLARGGGGRAGRGGADIPRELIADGATDPVRVASRRWTQSVVRTGIAELSENERQVILLGYAEDLSQAEIAERLEWPLGTVKSRTRRAMAQLRSRIGPVID